MNAILGMTHLAPDSGVTPRQHKQVAKAERAARSLKDALKDALQGALAQACGEPAAGVPPAEDDYEAMLADARRRLQGMRVLLVEDNDINAELATDLLQRAGMEVTLALDGEQALAALELIRVDVVLMDCEMPVMDGYAATRAIRADRRFDALPVIAMTANAMQGDREEVLRVGMDDHIPKPIEVQDLFDALVRWRAGRRPDRARGAGS